MGLLCIIPLVGGFVGIFLLGYGIFKYKDKILILIGLFGIALTVTMYSLLFYDVIHGQPSNDEIIKSKKKINKLAQEIELFKLQEGRYPESLIELQNKNNLVDIDDPLLFYSHGKKASILFSYENFGTKYKLFSKGVDQISNTLDDIYPDLKDGVNIRYGFINDSN